MGNKSEMNKTETLVTSILICLLCKLSRRKLPEIREIKKVLGHNIRSIYESETNNFFWKWEKKKPTSDPLWHVCDTHHLLDQALDLQLLVPGQVCKCFIQIFAWRSTICYIIPYRCLVYSESWRTVRNFETLETV